MYYFKLRIIYYISIYIISNIYIITFYLKKYNKRNAF